MNKELIEALDLLEKEKNISKETLLEAIENSLLTISERLTMLRSTSIRRQVIFLFMQKKK